MTSTRASQTPATPRLVCSRRLSAAVFAHGLLLTGATASIALAGFAPQGNLGIFLLFAGVALIFCPPSVPVPLRWWLGGGVLMGLCAGALLPAHFLPSHSTWRHTLAAIPVIPLPTTISPAPQETIFWLGLLLLTVVIALFVLAQPIRSHALLYLMLFAALVCGAYAVLSICAKFADWRPPLVHEPSFGFFPNRNHTATFLISGSILSLSLLTFAVLSRRWVILDLAIVALLPCITALFFFSGSRAGVVFLIIGVAVWMFGFGGGYRNRRILFVQATITLAIAGLFLTFQSPARDRLLSSVGLIPAPNVNRTPAPTRVALIPNGPPQEQATELRIPIWRDTLRMIVESPLTGTGLGTFSRVFPQYRRDSLSPAHALHPESDWLLFIAEAGLPAFVCLAALVIGLGMRLVTGRAHPYWPLRWGCATAALTALLHGAVDVPAHRAALGWWVLILAGLSLSLIQVNGNNDTNPECNLRRQRWNVQRGVFVLAGIGALVLGGMLIAAEWWGAPDLPPFFVEKSPFKIFKLQERKDFPAAEALARSVINMSPLFDQTYFDLGVALASQSDDERTDIKVDEAFRAQRLLDPDSPQVSLDQAGSWSGYDPVRQAAMLMDAVARQARLESREGYNPQHAFDYLGDLVGSLRGQPDVQRYLLGAIRPDVRFEHAWLTGATPELAREQAANIADDEALLLGLSETDRLLLRLDWYMRRETSPARSLLPDERGTAVQGWPVRLRQMVNAGQFENAVRELSLRYGISLELPQKLEVVNTTADSTDPMTAFQTAWFNQDFGTARRLLKKTAVDTSDPASLERLHWQAALAAHELDWAETWFDLEKYVQHTRQTEWP